jgi:hypothetical protein
MYLFTLSILFHGLIYDTELKRFLEFVYYTEVNKLMSSYTTFPPN